MSFAPARRATTSALALMLQAVFLCSLALGASAIDAEDKNKTASSTARSIFDSAQGVKVGGSILAVIAIGAGAVICAAGYKLFRPTLFAIGFAVGGTLFATVADAVFSSASYALTASWVAFVVGGVLVGCLVLSIYTTSLFVIGAAAGVVLATMINTSIGYRVYPSDPTTALIILCVVLGLVGGVLALKLEKPVLVVSTSLVGAGMLVWGVGYFAGDFPSATDLKQFATQTASGDWEYDMPSAWWGYLAGIVVAFALGTMLQFGKTGAGGDHHKSNA